jgi:hypothetical protein
VGLDLIEAEFVVEGGNGGDGVIAQLLGQLAVADGLLGGDSTDVSQQLDAALSGLGYRFIDRASLLVGEEEDLGGTAVDVEAGNTLLDVVLDEIAENLVVYLAVFVEGGQKCGIDSLKCVCHNSTSFYDIFFVFQFYGRPFLLLTDQAR